MIHSMTGYGSAQRAEDGVSYALEIRAVNHRYLKLVTKLPESLQFAEASLDKLVRSRVARGSVTYTLRTRVESGALPPIDMSVLQQYIDQFAGARIPAGVSATLDLSAMAQLPGVCQHAVWDDETRRRHARVIESMTVEAMDSLVAMRREEGEALGRDLDGIRASMKTELAGVTERAPYVVDEYRERLHGRVASLMNAGGFELAADGLTREVAVFAERCDINEELSRLESHLAQFAETCGREEQVGRTLDFLAQEMLRETNTIASKSNDVTITRHIVQIKRLIDRLKEQIQNVE